MNRRTKQIGAALVAGVTAVSLIPLSAAVADSSPASDHLTFSIQDDGYLVARGIAVDVSVEYTCSDGAAYGLSVAARQKISGGRIARGQAYHDTPLACDGEPHMVELRLDAGDHAFKSGQAFVTATTYACFPDACRYFEDELIARFRNKRAKK